MATVLVQCPNCQGEKVYRHGKSRNGTPRYRCCGCHHCFQLVYVYEANKPGVAEQIVELTMNGLGVNAVQRVLKISNTTVINHLKNSTLRPSRPSTSIVSVKTVG